MTLFEYDSVRSDSKRAFWEARVLRICEEMYWKVWQGKLRVVVALN